MKREVPEPGLVWIDLRLISFLLLEPLLALLFRRTGTAASTLRTGLFRMTGGGPDSDRLHDVMTATRFRRLRAKLDTPIAIKAMAAKLARLVYRMLRFGMKYVDQGAAFYDAQRRNLQIKHLKSRAARLGFQIVQVPAA